MGRRHQGLEGEPGWGSASSETHPDRFAARLRTDATSVYPDPRAQVVFHLIVENLDFNLLPALLLGAVTAWFTMPELKGSDEDGAEAVQSRVV